MIVAALPPPDRILVARGPGETRYALTAGETLVEVVHHRDNALLPGQVRFARIGAPAPGMQAVFAGLGEVTGLIKMNPPYLAEGAGIAATVVVPPRAGKNAELALAPDVPVPADGKPGALLAPAPDPAAAWWRLHGTTVKEVVCTPRAEAARLKDLLEAPVTVHAGPDNLFAGVDASIAEALEPIVPLTCGGTLIIESTAAAICIDVNAGPADADTANGDALAAVARALRLRNLAGHILVDCIPTRRKAALPRLLGGLTSGDPMDVRVAGLTPLGMLELTRRRVGLSLAETLCDAAGRPSAETIALHALRDAVRFAFSAKAAHVALDVSAEVAQALDGLAGALAEAGDMIKGEIRLTARPDFARARFEFNAA